MANKRDQQEFSKKLEEEFANYKDSSCLQVELEGSVSPSSEESDKAFPEKCNAVNDLLEEYDFEEKRLTITGDAVVKPSGSGSIDITVEKDSFLQIDFAATSFSAIEINVRVREGVFIDLLETLNAPSLYKVLNVYLERNARLNHASLVQDCEFSFNEVMLNQNSGFYLQGAYFSQGKKYYLFNKANHLEGNSISEMKVNGAVMERGKVINDGVVAIAEDAAYSTGHQDMKNLLIDRNSEVTSEPMLEINNDEVSCSHGASITQLGKEEEFYLLTRGLRKGKAIELIVNGFFESSLAVLREDQEAREEIADHFSFTIVSLDLE